MCKVKLIYKFIYFEYLNRMPRYATFIPLLNNVCHAKYEKTKRFSCSNTIMCLKNAVCSQAVSRLSLDCPRLSPGCLQAVFRLSLDCPRLSPGCLQAVSRLSLDCPRLSPGCLQAVPRLSPGRLQTIPRPSSDCFRFVLRLSPGYLVVDGVCLIKFSSSTAIWCTSFLFVI